MDPNHPTKDQHSPPDHVHHMSGLSRLSRWIQLVVLVQLFAGLLVVAGPEIFQFMGKDRAYVLQTLGPPNSAALSAQREVLTYPLGRLILSNGVVVDVGVPLSPARPVVNQGRIVQTNNSATQPKTIQPRTSLPITVRSSPTVTAPPILHPVSPTFAPSSPTKVITPNPPSPSPQSQHDLEISTPGITNLQHRANPYDEPPSVSSSSFSLLLKSLTWLVPIGLLFWAKTRLTQKSRKRPLNKHVTTVLPAMVKTEKSIASPQPPVPQRTHLDAQLLDELDWLLFEDLTAEYFRLDGFRADLSRMGADGGVDIYVHRMGESRPFAYVQCKAWGSRQIGVEPMRALYGVMAAAGIKEGYFFCIGEFSTDARSFAEANKIQLITGELFVARFNRFPEPDRVRILTRITQGDYTTPSCAKCGTKMKTKDFSGRGHWCCPRYPKCRSKPIAVRQRS